MTSRTHARSPGWQKAIESADLHLAEQLSPILGPRASDLEPTDVRVIANFTYTYHHPLTWQGRLELTVWRNDQTLLLDTDVTAEYTMPNIIQGPHATDWSNTVYNTLAACVRAMAPELRTLPEKIEAADSSNGPELHRQPSPVQCKLDTVQSSKIKPMIAVMDFTVLASDANNALGQALADLVRYAVSESGRYILLDRENIVDLLGEEDFIKAVRCTKTRCLVNYGKILEAQKLCTGRVNRAGSSLVLTLTITDVSTAKTDAFKTVRVQGTIDDLMNMLDPLTCDLMRDALATGP